MERMRKIFLGFMALLMLTPVLACAMTFCPSQAEAATPEMPCHEPDKPSTPMLALDCMGIDLFQQDFNDTAFLIDQTVDKTDMPWIVMASVHKAQTSSFKSIRAPPFDPFEHMQTAPPPLITTQRIRL